jgi:saccharopine dehydrogenase (NAD+, L-lysine forming)
MIIGILRETKIPHDTRVPLSPVQCKQVMERFPGIRINVQPSAFRCYTDQEYEKEGVPVKEDIRECDVLLGVKEVKPGHLIDEKTYLFFSHTIKKQHHNKEMLQQILKKQIRLIDYELLTDDQGFRILGFGRWAGLIGAYHGIRAHCLKHNLMELPLPQHFGNLQELHNYAASVALSPVKIIITGSGRVALGAEEMMQAFHVGKVQVDEFISMTVSGKPVYVQLDPAQYIRHRDQQPFLLEHFFRFPRSYQSNFARFCDKGDLLIMAAYWDTGAPKLMTPLEMADNGFSIRVIADISCDLNGSIPSTIKTTTFDDPYYDYNPHTLAVETPFSKPSNITVMAIDNLPCGLPREASSDFGSSIVQHVIPLLLQRSRNDIIDRATIAWQGQLTRGFRYLAEWVSKQD